MAQAASFFSAGFETSATTISFALYELALQPEMQNRLRKEILKALDQFDGKITYDMVRISHMLLYRKQYKIFIMNSIRKYYKCVIKSFLYYTYIFILYVTFILYYFFSAKTDN